MGTTYSKIAKAYKDFTTEEKEKYKTKAKEMKWKIFMKKATQKLQKEKNDYF